MLQGRGVTKCKVTIKQKFKKTDNRIIAEGNQVECAVST